MEQVKTEQSDNSYPLLRKAIAEGRVPDPDFQPPKRREPRCGPWVDGVCQKCGFRDRLDLLDEEDFRS